MALQNKNTFQKSGTCRKNLEVRQDNLSFIIIIIIIIFPLGYLVRCKESLMTFGPPVCVVFLMAKFCSTVKTRDDNNRIMSAGHFVFISSNVPFPQ